MIRISTPSGDYWDERRQQFITIEGRTVLLEHSLSSIARWEGRWKKPFLGKDKKTREETVDYIRCMSITPDVDPLIFETLTDQTILKISQYINSNITATTFSDRGTTKPSREIITAEVVYCWMTMLNIPFECDKWHFSRLMTLIRVCNIKNQPPKKMSNHELMSRNAKLNAERRKRLGTRG